MVQTVRATDEVDGITLVEFSQIYNMLNAINDMDDAWDEVKHINNLGKNYIQK